MLHLVFLYVVASSMPNPILLLSHGKPSKEYLGIVRGEMSNTERFKTLLIEGGYPHTISKDIFEIFGGDVHALYEPLAELNVELARGGFAMLDETALPHALDVRDTILKTNPEFLFILSWAWSGAALYATGIHKHCPVASKLYVHHENETVIAPLYEAHTLLLTESLLANQRAIAQGIAPWKMIHLPHHYPPQVKEVKPSRAYVEKLHERLKKTRPLKKETVVIGSISRLEFGKNIEFSLQIVEKLYEEGIDVVFVLKGGYEEYTPYPIYRDWLKEVVDSLQDKPWFLWDQEPTPHSAIFDVFSSFDLFLHLSGAEAGSNVVVEALALGLPTVIVDGTTNPSLFRGGACFVDHDGQMPQDLLHPFRVPEKEDLYRKVKELVTSNKSRKQLSINALNVAQARFCPERTLERLPLIFKALKAYHSQSSSCDLIKKEVEELYEQDLRRYDWSC